MPADGERRADGASPRAARAWLLRVPALVLVVGALVSVVADAALIGPVFRRARLELDPAARTLVVGASHAACAFDPEVLGGGVPGSAASVARHGELMLSTHAKLVALLDANPGVRRVILAFSPIHVAAWQDAHLFGQSPQSRAQLMEYYPLYDGRTRALLPLTNPDVLLASLKYDRGVPFDYTDDSALYARYVLGQLEPRHYRYWGGFTPLDGTHLDEGIVGRVVEKYFREQGEVAGVSELAIESLERMAALVQERGLELVLVDTPAHPRFRAQVPERHRAVHAATLDDLSARFPCVRVLRDGALEIPDAWFLDPDHLNRTGAAAYSRGVLERLEQGP